MKKSTTQTTHQIWQSELENYNKSVPILIPDDLEEDLNLDEYDLT